MGLGYTHRLHSSSFLGLPYRILNIQHKKEVLWSPMGRQRAASTGDHQISSRPGERAALFSMKWILGGSWVATSRVISTVTIAITYIMGLLPPLNSYP